MKMKSKSKICITAGNTTTLLRELIPVSIQALTLQLKLQHIFFCKKCCENRCSYIKLLRKSFQLHEKVVVLITLSDVVCEGH